MEGSLLVDAFGHHVWASLRIIDACAALSADQLATTVPGTYGSILETLRHTVGGEVAYLRVLTDDGPAPIDEESASLPVMRATMEAMGPAWAALLATDLEPDRSVVRHSGDAPAGMPDWALDVAAPLSIRLAQALHHGTDHRSQICTALTSLGLEPPDIDVWAYADTDGRVTDGPSGA